MKLPQYPQSYWLNSTKLPQFPSLKEDLKTDVVIVGGGISGVTLAYLLSKKGKSVVLLEAGEVLSGTTGHTTAKITCQHDVIYDEFLSHFGEKYAKQYYQANNEALSWIKQTVTEQSIDCDFKEQDAWLYTTSVDLVPDLKKELQAYQALGIEGELTDSTPLPFKTRAGLRMPKQAQFNPVKYLNKLLELAVQQGVQVFEHTTATAVDKPSYVITKEGHKIESKQIVSCSHFPFYDDQQFFFARMYAERSYALCFKPKQEYPEGMFLSIDQSKRSLRSVMIDGEQHIIVGGENHPTGQGICTIRHYETLEQFAEETFGIEKLLYRWSAQDLTTLDKLPFIGATDNKPELYVAAGYKKWGMTTGTAAALLLEKVITGERSPYVDLFAPKRFYADPTIKTFLTYAGNMAKHMVKGKLFASNRHAEDLENGEGSVVSLHGKRAGAYRDQEGKLFIVDTTCTHMGCEVEWNSGDLSWDCPCHGSRFSYQGEVLDGPADKPLHRIQ
ncbi:MULTISPECIES: FAD-dependent oxidoreductase [Paenibacillus]|uniref:FAD-dependent oxidoreductase n=1 Tax=Paenibacillus TaxID=44249 RepID=UPI00203B6942|nr:FAD-dependent oxidoreductase [Paenibacillus camelliae]MCM3634001.1 FAD-dependent oxidoreductase [Paenibacillus camelliae]